MINWLTDLVGGEVNLVIIVFYVYGTLINYKGEKMSGTGSMRSLGLAITWPIAMWKTMKKLYLVRD